MFLISLICVDRTLRSESILIAQNQIPFENNGNYCNKTSQFSNRKPVNIRSFEPKMNNKQAYELYHWTYNKYGLKIFRTLWLPFFGSVFR
jgi:hypothetical protein